MLVRTYGPKRWTFISRMLKGRIGKQCRERYKYYKEYFINSYLDGTIIWIRQL